MKKLVPALLAGTMAAAALLSSAACGGGSSETADRTAPAFSDAQATLSIGADIDRSNEDYIVSEDLFGVFLEDINYASYVLDDNLVKNGSFEGTKPSASDGWSVSGATLLVESSDGIFPAGTDYAKQGVNPNYARVTVTQANGYVENAGYDYVPMAVEEGTEYRFSAFIKSPDKAVTLTVSVTDGTNVYAEQAIDVEQNASWIRYTYTVTATGTANSGLSLRLSFDSAATVYLDAVSFETTDSTVGIKNYVYEAIKALEPKFIRFPGGCIVEGNGDLGMTGAYDWKNSIGAVQTGTEAGDDTVPAFTYIEIVDGTTRESGSTYGEPMTRKPNQDRWVGGNYYDMEYAIGFYEYFLLCESVGASAVPVLNCGLSCQGGGVGPAVALAGRHGKGVEDYIQDALDLVAFAKGDPDSTDEHEAYWAGIRKAMGHEEPFEMHYLGIGNEQYGVYFSNYYEKFLDPFNEAKESNPALYGDLKLIVGNGPLFSQCENDATNAVGEAKTAATVYRNKNAGKITNLSEYGVHDQHYYVNYTDLFTNTTMYDRYSRNERERYDVFVGEYSANTATNTKGTVFSFNGDNWENSWITALSEAAMMTGYERNGDVVKLAAYAPMFGHANRNVSQWKVNMMYYTNTELLLSANYYVQQLFMRNQGRYLFPDESLTFASDFEDTYLLTEGAASITIDKLYYVASMTEEGDIIVKVVNASPEAIRLNVAIEDARLTGIAHVTELQNSDYKAKNTLSESAISPEEYTIGGFSGRTIGHELPAYSVTAIRIHTR